MKVKPLILAIGAILSSSGALAAYELPHNSYFVFDHKIAQEVKYTERGDFFRRLLTYVDSNDISRDAYMDGFVFMHTDEYLRNGATFGDCTNADTCKSSFEQGRILREAYIKSHFDPDGYLDVLRSTEFNAVNTLGSEFTRKIPEIKVYFTIPNMDDPAVDDLSNANSFYVDALDAHMRTLHNKFTSWKEKDENKDSNIVMAGFYMSQEGLYIRDGIDNNVRRLMKRKDEDHTNSLLVLLKARIRAIDDKYTMVASPHQNYYPDWKTGDMMMATSYETSETTLFAGEDVDAPILDTNWLQPNAFYGGWKFDEVVDKEVIRWTHAYYRNYPYIGYNMETQPRIEPKAIGKEHFHEIINYVDYAAYLGLNTYRTAHYDQGTALYKWSTSATDAEEDNTPDEHWVYAEAFSMSKRVRDGFITNGGFEYFDLPNPPSMQPYKADLIVKSTELSDYNASKLLGWVGTGTKGVNNNARVTDFSFSTVPGQRPSLGQFNLPNQAHSLKFKVTEPVDDSQPYSGIATLRFFDAEGHQITTGSVGNVDLKYSPYVKGWYQYVVSSTVDKQINIDFTPPDGAVKTELVLGNWNGNANLVWSNVSITDKASGNNLYLIGKDKDGNFTAMDFHTSGQYASLQRGQYIESERAFNVTPGQPYNLTFDSQKDGGIICSIHDGVVGVKFFNEDDSLYIGSVPGFTSPPNSSTHYRYFDTAEFPVNQTVDFSAPANVAKAKVYVRNWGCSGEIKLDNISLNDANLALQERLNSAEPTGLDQQKLYRLNADNRRARMRFDLTQGKKSSINLTKRVNCNDITDKSCKAVGEVNLAYLDSQGKVLKTQSQTFDVNGEGEKASLLGLVDSHWKTHSLPLTDVPGATQINVEVRLDSGSTGKEMLFSRPHLK